MRFALLLNLFCPYKTDSAWANWHSQFAMHSLAWLYLLGFLRFHFPAGITVLRIHWFAKSRFPIPRFDGILVLTNRYFIKPRFCKFMIFRFRIFPNQVLQASGFPDRSFLKSWFANSRFFQITVFQTKVRRNQIFGITVLLNYGFAKMPSRFFRSWFCETGVASLLGELAQPIRHAFYGLVCISQPKSRFHEFTGLPNPDFRNQGFVGIRFSPKSLFLYVAIRLCHAAGF